MNIGFGKIVQAITSEKELGMDARKILALLTTLAAIVFGCLWYIRSPSQEFWQLMVWPIPIVPHKLSVQTPGIPQGLLGMLICAPLYARNLLPFRTKSPYFYITLVLNLVLFAVLAQLVLGRRFSLAYNFTNMILIVCLVVTWLGIRSMAGLAWIIFFFLASYNLLNADMQLKFGLPFLISGFLSILFQSELSPAELFKSFKDEFRGGKGERLDFVKESMRGSIEGTGRMIKSGAVGVGKVLIK